MTRPARNAAHWYSNMTRRGFLDLRGGGVIACAWLIFAALMLHAAAHAQTIRYTYDEVGRLKSVTNSANETAEYVYDAAGNLTQVRRTAANIPAVTEFTPDRGPVGTVVTVVGASFGATPGANTVRFNGTLASVSSASATQLVATVPAGATTGAISVQTTAGTGTSAQSFTVTGSATGLPPPTVSGISPASGIVGASITISGTNFNTTPGMTKVYLNQTLAVIQSISATSITITVPQQTGSGRIRVVTLSGTASSTSDFVVIPQNGQWQQADFSGTTLRVTLGGSVSGSLSASTTQTRWLMILFDGGSDVPVTIDFPAYSATAPSPPGNPGADWEVRGLRNEVLTSSGFETSSGNEQRLSFRKRSIHIPPTPIAGTYALLVKIAGSGTASLSLTANLRADLELVPDGAERVFATTFQGQAPRYYFKGVAGQDLGLALQGYTQTGGSDTTGIEIRRPDWNHLQDDTGGTSSFSCVAAFSAAHACAQNLKRIPLTATYSVIVKAPVNSPSITSVGGKLWLSNDLAMGNLPLDSDVNIPTLRVGQNARLQFDGTAGQRYGLSVSDLVFTPTYPQPAPTKVLTATGVEVGSVNGAAGTTKVQSVELPALPSSGPYTVFVDPVDGASGTGQVRLWQAVTGSIAIGGSSVPLSLIKGQVARYTFTATAGQNLGLAVSSVTFTPSSPNGLLIDVRRVSDNAQVGTKTCGNTAPFRCDVDLPGLVAGNYTIEIRPPVDVRTTTLDLTLSADITATIALNTETALSIPRLGQNARYTFAGTTGQSMRLSFANLALLGGQQAQATVLRSNGVVLDGPFTVFPGASRTLRTLPPLPANDTYTVFVNPNIASTGTMSVTLSTDIIGTIAVDGASQSVALTVPGQAARYSFTVATAGQNRGIGISNVAVAPGGTTPATISLLRSNNTAVTSVLPNLMFSGTAYMLNGINLPADTYTLLVEPSTNATSWSLNLTVSTDVVGALVLNTAYPLSVARRGQDARLTFSGTAGQNRRLTVTGLTTGPTPTNANVNVTVLHPNGTTQSYSSWVNPSSGILNFANLPATGTYTVWFDQLNGLTFNLTATLTQY
jgi:YD repeat-containing protein